MIKILIYTCKSEETELEKVPSTIRLLPLGLVSSQKGKFNVDTESFTLMQKQFEERGVDIVIDYEHQTLDNVQAPAGGWVKELVLEDDFISAKVEWTPQGKKYLENKEYRYISPVILVRPRDKKAINLHSVALTNTPAINGMFPIINSIDIDDYDEGENDVMEFMQKLAEVMGLEASATEEQILKKLQETIKEGVALNAEIKNYKGKDNTYEVVANKTICQLLNVPDTAKTEDVAAAIVALKAPASIEAEFRALKADIENRNASDAVLSAMKLGKVSAAQEDWAKEYALKDPSGFGKFVEKAPQAVPTYEIAFDNQSKVSSFDDELTMKVCKQLGVNRESYEKFGKDIE